MTKIRPRGKYTIARQHSMNNNRLAPLRSARKRQPPLRTPEQTWALLFHKQAPRASALILADWVLSQIGSTSQTQRHHILELLNRWRDRGFLDTQFRPNQTTQPKQGEKKSNGTNGSKK